VETVDVNTSGGHHGHKSLRRGFLLGSAAAAVSGAAGLAAGYELRPGTPVVSEPGSTSGRREFAEQAEKIRGAHANQTRATVRLLKSKYEDALFGKVRVWEMIEKLGLCIDPSDDTLLLTSQYVHVQQVLEGMERDGVTDRDMLLIALLHDLGKVMLLTAEVPEHVVGYNELFGDYPAGVGLDQVVYQFGHDELIYSRLKDHVPAHIAWTIRHHGASLRMAEPFLNDQDRLYRDRYLAKFQIYDQDLKSSGHLPRVEMAKYRALIEDTFPHPILL
jgi:hypothetical protein